MQIPQHNSQPPRFRACPWLMLLACLLSMAAPALLGRFRAEAPNAVQTARAQTASAMLSAQAALAAKLPSVQFEKNRAGNAVEVVGTRVAGQWLRPANAATHEATARAFLGEQSALFG